MFSAESEVSQEGEGEASVEAQVKAPQVFAT